MIVFSNLDSKEPFSIFRDTYNRALENNQKNIEACAISSFNKADKEINTRFVNIKNLDKNTFTFYSNYRSNKASDFESHNQISMTFFWNEIGSQIRIKAFIKKSDKRKSDTYFLKRNSDKNKLAILSKQSKPIQSYETLIEQYNTFDKNKDLTVRPEYWGGYDCMPYYFEFWEGHDFRLNKRKEYSLQNSTWESKFLYP